jgi:hypothetical protein
VSNDIPQELINGSDCASHWHSIDRIPTHDTLTALQGLTNAVTITTAAYTVIGTENYLIDTVGSTIKLLPAKNGQELVIIKVTASGTTTITAASVDTINGAASRTLTEQWSIAHLKNIKGYAWLANITTGLNLIALNSLVFTGSNAGISNLNSLVFTGSNAGISNLNSLVFIGSNAGISNLNSLVFTGSNAGISNLNSLVFTGSNAGISNLTSINGGQLAGNRNKIINGDFSINQLAVSGTVTLAAGAYGHDGFKGGAAGCTYTFATVNNLTTVTISAGSLIQVIRGTYFQSGTYTLSWSGTAQGKIGAGALSASGVTGAAVGGTNLNVEFGTGTLSLVQFELGTVATSFEFRLNELQICQRDFEKSFDYATAPANGPNATTLLTVDGKLAIASHNIYGASVRFKVQKNSAPTIIPYGNNAGLLLSATWNAVNVYISPTVNGFSAQQQETGGLYVLVGHWTASCRL